MIKIKHFGPVTQFEMARLIDGKALYSMACYYVDGLLIDSGPAHVAEEIETVFSSYPVNIIVNTHHHEDHIGNNIIFQKKYDTGPSLAHELAVPRIIDTDSWKSELYPYQQLVWGFAPPSKASVIGKNVKTTLYTFQVIHTPGHSIDHICLIEEKEGWLFSGDLFLAEKVSGLRSDEDVKQSLQSLYKLLDYDFNTIFCASGKVVKNAREAVKAKITYWEETASKIKTLYGKGFTFEEIRAELFGKESALFTITEEDFSKINLVRSFLGIKNLSRR